jgi:hypothetical protein
MKIECILHRKGGTHVEMPGKTYHFAEQADGRHVADVANDTHIERFLAIPEAYRIARAPGEPEPAPLPVPVAAPIPAPTQELASLVEIDPSLLAAPGFEATYDINGRTYALAEFVQHAFTASGMDRDGWNEMGEDARAVKIEQVMDDVADGELTLAAPLFPPAADAAEAPAADDRDALAAQYKAKFGKAPHGKWDAATIQAKLADKE